MGMKEKLSVIFYHCQFQLNFFLKLNLHIFNVSISRIFLSFEGVQEGYICLKYFNMNHYKGKVKPIYCFDYSPSDKLHSSDTASKFIATSGLLLLLIILIYLFRFHIGLNQEFLVMIKFLEYPAFFTVCFMSYFFNCIHSIIYLDVFHGC